MIIEKKHWVCDICGFTAYIKTNECYACCAREQAEFKRTQKYLSSFIKVI